MTDPQTSNADFALAWTYWTERSPAGRITRDGDLIAPWMGTAWPIGNLTFLARPVDDGADLDRRVDGALDQARGSQLGWLLFVCLDLLPEGLRPGLEESLKSKGLAAIVPMTGMTAPGLLPPRRALPDLELVRVGDPETRRDFAAVNAAAYDMPPEWVVETLDPQAFWGEDAHGFVGYVDGRPVTTAKTIPLGERHYVGLVATVPELQRQGYGERVMRHSVASAQAAGGKRPLVLHATPYGRPLYLEMGFAPVAEFVGFAPDEGGHGA
jgi:ribosomal protein S18 acetylase RimI-like enzyme